MELSKISGLPQQARRFGRVVGHAESFHSHIFAALRRLHPFEGRASAASPRASGIIQPGAQIELGPCGPRQVILLTESGRHLAED
jgi:hypothetical protein